MLTEVDAIQSARDYWHSNEMDAFDAVLLLPHGDPRLNAKLRATFVIISPWAE
jgi:hypothetical protein